MSRPLHPTEMSRQLVQNKISTMSTRKLQAWKSRDSSIQFPVSTCYWEPHRQSSGNPNGKDCHVSIRIWSLPNADERTHVKLNSAHPTGVPLKWAVQVIVSFVHHPFLEMTGIMEQLLLSYLHWQLLHLKNLKQKLKVFDSCNLWFGILWQYYAIFQNILVV